MYTRMCMCYDIRAESHPFINYCSTYVFLGDKKKNYNPRESRSMFNVIIVSGRFGLAFM